MVNALEQLVAHLNGGLFYREFSFDTNQFTPKRGEQKELTDHVIWIDDLLIIMQLKQRDTPSDSEGEEEKWFTKKVLGTGTRQVRDTLQFLDQYSPISIQNQRGHRFEVNKASIKHILKLVIYAPGERIPQVSLARRHHVSSTAGFIHIISWEDYRLVCAALITPAELIEYFEFREEILKRWTGTHLPLSEQAMLGRFFVDAVTDTPLTDEDVEAYYALHEDSSEFDISYLLQNIGDHLDLTDPSTNERDYYRVLAEFAKLNRTYLREVKRRVVVCLEAVQEDRFTRPNRMIIPGSGCGFVFIPLEAAAYDFHRTALNNLTAAAKYDQQLERHVGVSFAKRGEYIDIGWCFMDFPWEYNKDLETMLQHSYPFRPLREAIKNRYTLG